MDTTYPSVVHNVNSEPGNFFANKPSEGRNLTTTWTTVQPYSLISFIRSLLQPPRSSPPRPLLPATNPVPLPPPVHNNLQPIPDTTDLPPCPHPHHQPRSHQGRRNLGCCYQVGRQRTGRGRATTGQRVRRISRRLMIPYRLVWLDVFVNVKITCLFACVFLRPSQLFF